MTTPNPQPPPYTDRPWAKADRENSGRIHLLEHHLADVGACFEQLLRQPTIRQRLAYAGGREWLDETTAARLTVFAARHIFHQPLAQGLAGRIFLYPRLLWLVLTLQRIAAHNI